MCWNVGTAYGQGQREELASITTEMCRRNFLTAGLLSTLPFSFHAAGNTTAGRRASSARPHGEGAIFVPVLIGDFKGETNGLTFKRFAVAARRHDSFVRSSLGSLLVPQVAEMEKASAWRLRRIEYTPAFVSVPDAHSPGYMHTPR